MKYLNKFYFTLIIGLVCFMMNSCYSLSGSSIDYTVTKTIQIDNFPNLSTLQNPNLSQDFTLALQDRFIQRTKLSLVNNSEDMVIDGSINNYFLSPVNVQTGDIAAQTRLTITYTINFENKKDPKKSFNKTISEYADFNANQTLEQNQDALVETINTKVIDQIYNAIASDW